MYVDGDVDNTWVVMSWRGILRRLWESFRGCWCWGDGVDGVFGGESNHFLL